MEKPSPLTLAPHDFANIKANVKVASTENGIIFGNIGKYLVFTINKFLIFKVFMLGDKPKSLHSQKVLPLALGCVYNLSRIRYRH